MFFTKKNSMLIWSACCLLIVSVLFLKSPVHAATTWQLNATPIETTDPWSPFSVTFFDDNDDRVVDINNVNAFSGVYLPYHLTDVIAVPDLFYVGEYRFIDIEEGLRIDGPNHYEDLGWTFGGSFVSLQHRDNWTYTAHQVVPIPGAVWLLGSGLVGFVGLRKKIRR